MKRREFIAALGGAAAWPMVARAQQPEHMRRVGVLQLRPRTIPKDRLHIGAFLQTLQQLGWTDGRNIQILRRFTDGDPDRARTYAAELVRGRTRTEFYILLV